MKNGRKVKKKKNEGEFKICKKRMRNVRKNILQESY